MRKLHKTLLRPSQGKARNKENSLTCSALSRTAKISSAAALENERRIQQSLLAIKQKFGKNAVIKGRDLEDGATAMQRNDQIGGHKA